MNITWYLLNYLYYGSNVVTIVNFEFLVIIILTKQMPK